MVDETVERIAEKIYNIVKDEFNPTSQIKFTELNEQRKTFYRKNVINILILDDNSWKYFHTAADGED